MVTFCPSTIPYSAKPLRKASTKCALSPADRALRNPIIGLFVGCEFAASGGQTAEPAITLINSRRLIQLSEASDTPCYRLKQRDWKRLLMSALGQKQTIKRSLERLSGAR